MLGSSMHDLAQYSIGGGGPKSKKKKIGTIWFAILGCTEFIPNLIGLVWYETILVRFWASVISSLFNFVL